MDWNLLLVPGVALGRALLGWIENAFKDGKIDLPEWKQLGATVVRMGLPMAALIWGFKLPVEMAGGIAILMDIVIVKLYNAIKKSK